MTSTSLRAIDAFVEFPDHDIALLDGISRMVTFPPDSTIIEQDERARAAYVLFEGEVEVVRRLPGGTRTRLAMLQHGAVFGAVALLDGGTRAASCRAASEVKALEIMAADFQRLTEASTPLGARFLMLVCRQLVRDLRYTNQRIAMLAGLATLTPDDVAEGLRVILLHALPRGVAGPQIELRRFRRGAGPLDAAWMADRVDLALRRRSSITPGTTALRLVNAENDDLPGIRADRWGPELVVSVDSPSLIRLGEQLAEHLQAALPALTGAWLAERRDPRDTERRLPSPRRIFGSGPEDVIVEELGLQYEVRPSLGKDAGLFTDMRCNRAWLASTWSGQRVLNLFAHTGAFSVSARAHGAVEVVSVDLSETYLSRARRNFGLNRLDSGELLVEDSFKALDRFRRQGRRFDRIVVDPPGYSHSADGAWRGEKEWPRLTAACLRVLDPGGWLIAASNLGSQSPKHFGGALAEGAERAERSLRLLHEGTPGPDHPAALHFPESRYSKFWVMEGNADGA